MSLFSSLVHLILYWWCNEKFYIGHSWELMVNYLTDKILNLYVWLCRRLRCLAMCNVWQVRHDGSTGWFFRSDNNNLLWNLRWYETSLTDQVCLAKISGYMIIHAYGHWHFLNPIMVQEKGKQPVAWQYWWYNCGMPFNSIKINFL